MKFSTLLLLILPITSMAECEGLVKHLNNEHPNRILTQTYGFTLDRLVVYEKSKKPHALLSVVECVNNNYQTLNTFEVNEASISDIQFDETAGTVIVVFSIDPENTGYIERVNGLYTYTPGLYEK